MYAKTVEELVIYQIASQLAKEINELIKQIPHYWTIEEYDQILRSSGSCPSNIAEGFGQRFYSKKFIYFLNNAIGSSDESKDHITKLGNNGHIKPEIADSYIKRYKNLSIKTINFANYLRKIHDIR
jgi:four helix bundle protein